MTRLRLFPAALALLLLTAHFYRARQAAGIAVAAGLLLLLFVTRRWALRAVQLGLAAGALEWLRVLLSFAELRAGYGAPWTRLAWILGGVAAFTAGAAWLLEGRIAALEKPASGSDGQSEGGRA